MLVGEVGGLEVGRHANHLNGRLAAIQRDDGAATVRADEVRLRQVRQGVAFKNQLLGAREEVRDDARTGARKQAGRAAAGDRVRSERSSRATHLDRTGGQHRGVATAEARGAHLRGIAANSRVLAAAERDRARLGDAEAAQNVVQERRNRREVEVKRKRAADLLVTDRQRNGGRALDGDAGAAEARDRGVRAERQVDLAYADRVSAIKRSGEAHEVIPLCAEFVEEDPKPVKQNSCQCFDAIPFATAR